MNFYPNLVLAKGPLNSEDHTILCLARKDPSSDAQKFKFSPVVSGQTYLIVCKDGERSLDVMNSSYTAGTDIILTGQPEGVTPGRNKQWIVEACGGRIESLMTLWRCGEKPDARIILRTDLGRNTARGIYLR